MISCQFENYFLLDSGREFQRAGSQELFYLCKAWFYDVQPFRQGLSKRQLSLHCPVCSESHFQRCTYVRIHVDVFVYVKAIIRK